MTRRRSTVDANVGANENGDRAWYTLVHRHLLRFGDGVEQGFLVHERQTELGVMVVEPPEKRVADAQVPAMLDRIEAGRQVTFGPLTADAHGLFVPGGRLAYRWLRPRRPAPHRAASLGGRELVCAGRPVEAAASRRYEANALDGTPLRGAGNCATSHDGPVTRKRSAPPTPLGAQPHESSPMANAASRSCCE